MAVMTRPHFSIGAMLLATTAFGLAAWLAQFVEVRGSRDPGAIAVTLIVTVLTGPPVFAIVGASMGSRSNSRWLGAILGLALGTLVVLLLTLIIWI